MMKCIVISAVLVIAVIVVMYQLNARKERRLLTCLENMIDDAANERFEISKYTEEELSLVESKLKRLIERSNVSKESQKEQKETIQKLISDIAHQTLTPISNLKLYSELLQEKYKNDEMMNAVSEEAEKLNFLISALVKVSRLENGIVSVNPVEMSIEPLLSHVEDAFVNRARDKDIEYIVNISDVRAVYDLKWTKEALSNIVDNAVKYTKPGGRVEISCQKYSFFVRIDISDTGIGIAKEDMLDMKESFSKYVNKYYFIGGILTTILLFIGVMNLFNVISTSIISGKRELGMLEAVGMTEKSIIWMLIAEGFIYFAGAFIIAALIICFASESILAHTIGNAFYFHMHLTLMPIAVMIPLFVLIAIIIPYRQYRRMCKESVVERIKV